MTLTDQFIELICSIRYEDISSSALNKLRVCLADTISVTIAGSADLKIRNKKLLALLDDGSKLIEPIGIEQKTSIANTILVNGLNAHFLELDDGVRYGVIHPSAPLFSALIPIAKVNNVSWEQFILGSICGYETSIRLASAMQPSHYSMGYHPTATCCTVGVAVGVAVMLGFTKEEVKDAFSAATISSYGTLKVLEDVSQLKPFNCGKAALMGYYAAMMAKAGYHGPKEALTGDSGFFHMMCQNYDKRRLLEWDGVYAVEKIYLKPYASCRHTHPEIEAAFSIRQNEGFSVENICGISVITYKGVIGKHDGKTIFGESSARMSIPYSLAVALYTGKAGIEEFTDKHINNPLIQKMTKMCVIKGDEELSKLVPDQRVAIVSVMMNDGRTFEQRVDYPKGEPENPLSKEEFYAKFSSMTAHAGFDSVRSSLLFDSLMNGDKIDFNKLFCLT